MGKQTIRFNLQSIKLCLIIVYRAREKIKAYYDKQTNEAEQLYNWCLFGNL